MLGAINSAGVNRIAINGGYPAISELVLSQLQAAQTILAAGGSAISAGAALAQLGNSVSSAASSSVVAVLNVVQGGNSSSIMAAVSVAGVLVIAQDKNLIFVLSKSKMANHLGKSQITDHSTAGSMSSHVVTKRTLLRH